MNAWYCTEQEMCHSICMQLTEMLIRMNGKRKKRIKERDETNNKKEKDLKSVCVCACVCYSYKNVKRINLISEEMAAR